ncbi:DUF6095 family protein [Xanthomarina spongicola]|uniref:Uncharacterized protein n=1 Tax=Xanthomarina spongicola TaxID=570520 RepID=A0A316DPP3_9FLAO|nr:DUF6095 family protein [Xanthomarina spongicola]PWK19468.1 hypothetical protein LX78_00815 [Xanthomarina spongicola]
METKRTNKDTLIKGLKKMGLSLVCMFLGPTLIYVAFSNQEKTLYIPLLILSILICILAVYLAFIGLKTIMDSMFYKTTN